MDELKIVKLAELRRKIASIPAKLLVAVLLSFGLYCQFDTQKFMENPAQNIFMLVVMYGIVSYFWLCVRATGNWIIGFIVAFGLIFIWAFCGQKMSELIQTLIACAILFGGLVMDILAIIRYFLLKRKVFRVQIEYGDKEPQMDWEQYQNQGSSQQTQNGNGQQAQTGSRQQEASSGFFNGCKDTASIKRRYKDLCKVYHPDSGNGSAEIFNKITQEYDRLMAQQTGTASKEN